MVGPLSGDAAVIRIKGTDRGLAMKTDCNPRYCYLDPYTGGLHAVLEAARNVACVGGEVVAFTNCLNFGNPERPEVYYQLKRAVEGMAVACRALEAPVVSGNVSLYNQTGSESILPTPTIGAVGVLDDVSLHTGSAFQDGGAVYLIGATDASLGGSEYLARMHSMTAGEPPAVELDLELNVQQTTRDAIRARLVVAAHDCSEGGLAVALAESCIAGRIGGRFNVSELAEANNNRIDQTLFGEAASRVILQSESGKEADLEEFFAQRLVPFTRLGEAGGSTFAIEGVLEVPLAVAADAWNSALVL